MASTTERGRDSSTCLHGLDDDEKEDDIFSAFLLSHSKNDTGSVSVSQTLIEFNPLSSNADNRRFVTFSESLEIIGCIKKAHLSLGRVSLFQKGAGDFAFMEHEFDEVSMSGLNERALEKLSRNDSGVRFEEVTSDYPSPGKSSPMCWGIPKKRRSLFKRIFFKE
jgi:hypothetical protein